MGFHRLPFLFLVRISHSISMPSRHSPPLDFHETHEGSVSEHWKPNTKCISDRMASVWQHLVSNVPCPDSPPPYPAPHPSIHGWKSLYSSVQRKCSFFYIIPIEAQLPACHRSVSYSLYGFRCWLSIHLVSKREKCLSGIKYLAGYTKNGIV